MKRLLLGLLLGGICFLLQVEHTRAFSYKGDEWTEAKTEASDPA
jgi:hypothetical protein